MIRDQNILIVEDNSFLALDMALTVEAQGGMVVGPVASVAEALALIIQEDISGAVLDCQLPDGDVSAVVIALFEKDIPMVIHTGTGLPPRLLPLVTGLPVLMKPVKPEAVLESLVTQIRRRVEER